MSVVAMDECDFNELVDREKVKSGIVYLKMTINDLADNMTITLRHGFEDQLYKCYLRGALFQPPSEGMSSFELAAQLLGQQDKHDGADHFKTKSEVLYQVYRLCEHEEEKDAK